MSVEFDGADAYFNCGSDVSIDDIAIKTITGWINLDTLDANPRRIMDKREDAATFEGWLVAVVDDAGSFNANSLVFLQWWSDTHGAWASPTNSLSTGSWIHFAIVYDKGATTNNPVMYIDGSVVAVDETSTPAGTCPSEAAQPLLIGALSDGDATKYAGEMEDICVVNRGFTAAEVSQLAAGYRGPLGGEVLWLSMTGARGVSGGFEGASLANGTNLLPDLSVNSNDGDPVNTPTGRASSAPRYGVAV